MLFLVSLLVISALPERGFLPTLLYLNRLLQSLGYKDYWTQCQTEDHPPIMAKE